MPLDGGHHPTGAGPALGLELKLAKDTTGFFGGPSTGRVSRCPIRRCNTCGRQADGVADGLVLQQLV